MPHFRATEFRSAALLRSSSLHSPLLPAQVFPYPVRDFFKPFRRLGEGETEPALTAFAETGTGDAEDAGFSKYDEAKTSITLQLK
jgi:hypothetical protein